MTTGTLQLVVKVMCQKNKIMQVLIIVNNEIVYFSPMKGYGESCSFAVIVLMQNGTGKVCNVVVVNVTLKLKTISVVIGVRI